MKNLHTFVQSSLAGSSSFLVAANDVDKSLSSNLIPGSVIAASIPAVIASLAYMVNSKVFQTHSSQAWLYKVVWAGAFLLNLLTVSLPGRFDGEAANASKIENGVEVSKPVWHTLFEPSGWAFAIWGVIYLTEAILTSSVLFVTQSSTLSIALQKATPFWLAGNLFQSLWCFAFRPAFRNALWLPMCLLGLGAVSFGGVHREFSLALQTLPTNTPFTLRALSLLLVRFPLALHMGWLSAATLLNFNAWVSVSRCTLSTQVSAAYLSAYLAAVVGVSRSVNTRDPFIALTVAWALAGVSSRTAQKVTVDAKKLYRGKDKGKEIVPSVIHESLAFTESWLSTALVALAAGVTLSCTADKVNRLF